MSFPQYPEYKDSGVEWLGEVPEHWPVVSIKWLSPVKRGASPRPIDDPKYFDEEGEYAWVRIADVSASDGILRETTQRLSSLGSSLSVKIGPGDLFVSIGYNRKFQTADMCGLITPPFTAKIFVPILTTRFSDLTRDCPGVNRSARCVPASLFANCRICVLFCCRT